MVLILGKEFYLSLRWGQEMLESVLQWSFNSNNSSFTLMKSDLIRQIINWLLKFQEFPNLFYNQQDQIMISLIHLQ